MKTCRPSPRRQAFTIVELLLSVTILSLLILLLGDTVGRIQSTMSRATAHVAQFQEARSALDVMSSTLSQAVMDGYWAYDNATAPTAYQRASDHHFILAGGQSLIGTQVEPSQAMFFQAPLGFAGTFTEDAAATGGPGLEHLHQLVNCVGFYLQYGSDIPERPAFMQSGTAQVTNPPRSRFRLMQYSQPAEESTLYSYSLRLNKAISRAAALKWFQDDLADHSRPVADNILGMVLVPYSINVTRHGSSNFSDMKMEPDAAYGYDSRAFQWGGADAISVSRRHQLPPMVQITLFATEEKSYDRFVSLSGGDAAAAGKVREVFKDRFTDYSKFEEDLEAVETGLNEMKLHHKTLTTTVSLRGSKWVTEP